MSARPYPRGLVHIQQGAAEVEQRAQHEVGEEDGDALATVALRVQEGAQHVSCDADDEHQRGDRPERVHVVGETESSPALERVAEPLLLDHRSRHGEADEREPGEPRQDVDRT